MTFDPVRGHEQGGVRPGLVVSNDLFNRTPHTFCILVPLLLLASLALNALWLLR